MGVDGQNEPRAIGETVGVGPRLCGLDLGNGEFHVEGWWMTGRKGGYESLFFGLFFTPFLPINVSGYPQITTDGRGQKIQCWCGFSAGLKILLDVKKLPDGVP